MKPATKLGVWVAIDALLTLLVWAALAGLFWNFGEGVIAERRAWIALLLVADAALFLVLGLRWIAQSVVAAGDLASHPARQ